MASTHETIGKRIRTARMRADLTLEQVADKLGVTRQAVEQWEQGHTRPHANKQRRLCEVLQMELGDLIP